MENQTPIKKLYTVEEFKNMLDKFVELCKKHNFIKEDSSIYFADNISSSTPKDLLDEYEQIICYADAVLITPRGQADIHRHRILEVMSGGKYKVIRGEHDSFGWLSGIIITPVCRIVYG